MTASLLYATDLVQNVCSLTITQRYLSDLREVMRSNGVAAAVRRRDTAHLVEWLVEVLSYQGVSDALAARYMAEHGRVSIGQVQDVLNARPSCPRLQSYAQFDGCGYAKTARTCAEPGHFNRCPLPTFDLRNGRLNQIAFALALFVRDSCQGDLVGWIDDQLAGANRSLGNDRSLRIGAALMAPLTRVHGLSYKVLSMALADLLLGAGWNRPGWLAAGKGMIAIDTLVHNWLARTGILDRFGADHAYGPGCYRPGMCADIIAVCAANIDAREFCPSGPRTFPRLVQHGLWRFCAENGYGICNGNRIDDRFGCGLQSCPIYPRCDRRPISQIKYVVVR